MHLKRENPSFPTGRERGIARWRPVPGAGSCDVGGWKKTAEQESKQETDTPSFLKVIAAYSS